jgi:hypothetical protein
MPDLVFHDVAKYLNLSDLYTLTSVNKDLRRRCLTDMAIQNILRDILVDMNLVPTYPKSYYTRSHPTSKTIFRTTNSNPHPYERGDWFLYGNHLNLSTSMQNRRRILGIISQMKIQSIKNAQEQKYFDNDNLKQNCLRSIIDQQLVIRKLNIIGIPDLFVKGMALLNKAFEIDLKKGRLKGNKMAAAVERVEALIENERRGSKHIGLVEENRMIAKINERMKLNMAEGEMLRRSRRV